jgi:hypothetical protein
VKEEGCEGQRNKVDLFPLLVPQCFEVVFAKIFKGWNVSSGGCLLGLLVYLSVYQELCIGHDTPLNTIAHSGVNTRITILKITFQGKLVFQGNVKGTV